MQRQVLALVFLVGCGGPNASLEVTFTDELVEAPARTVDITVVDSSDCEALLSVPHDEAKSVGSVLAQRQAAYPLDPESDLLDELPTGRALAFDIAVYDATPTLIARNCQVAEISASNDTQIKVPMLSLPLCATPPTALDLMIVLDLSVAAAVADISMGGQMIPRVRAFVASGFSAGTTVTVVTHGPAAPTVLVGPTSVLTEVDAALEPLPTMYLGQGEPYEAIAMGTSLLRARAVCGRRPALLTLVASPDSGALGSLDEALIGVAAARMEPADDIFTAGIGVSVDGNTALVDLLGDTLGVRYGALVEDTLVNALSASRLRFQSLIELVD